MFSLAPLSENSIPPATLLRYRLRWYAISTACSLLRRWQALLLLCGILASANVSLLTHVKSLATPLLALLSPGHGAAWHFGYLILLQAVAVMWALMPREQIGGGAFMQYAGSLPFTGRLRRLVDTVVLVLAETPLLVPGRGEGHLQAAQLLSMPVVGLLALAAQLAVLDRRRLAWIVVAACNLLLAAAINTGFQAGACVLAGMAACVLLAMPLPSASVRWQALPARAGAPFAAPLAAMGERVHPALRISATILFRQRRSETVGKALVAGCIAAAALALMQVFEHDARAFGVAVLA